MHIKRLFLTKLLYISLYFFCVEKISFAEIDSDLVGNNNKNETQETDKVNTYSKNVSFDVVEKDGVTENQSDVNNNFKEQVEEAQEVKQIEVLNNKNMQDVARKVPSNMFDNYNQDTFTIDKRNKKVSSKFELSISELSKTKDGGSLKMMQEAYKRYKQQDYELSLLYYKRALLYNPKNVEALFGAGVCYHKLLQYDQAIEMYLKILSNNFSRRKIVSNLLFALSHKSNKDALDILLSIDDKILGYSDILSQIGILYMKSGDNIKAISAFSRAYELSPTDAIIAYNLGILYDKEGNIDYAKHFYDQAIRNDIFDIISKDDGNLLQNRIEQINQQIMKDLEKVRKK